MLSNSELAEMLDISHLESPIKNYDGPPVACPISLICGRFRDRTRLAYLTTRSSGGLAVFRSDRPGATWATEWDSTLEKVNYDTYQTQMKLYSKEMRAWERAQPARAKYDIYELLGLKEEGKLPHPKAPIWKPSKPALRKPPFKSYMFEARAGEKAFRVALVQHLRKEAHFHGQRKVDNWVSLLIQNPHNAQILESSL